jgi:hypothetical protein
MPNFKLSDTVRKHIKDRATEFAGRARQYAEADFPMEVHQVQMAVMEPHLIQACRELYDSDVHTIRKHDRIRMVFLREQFPGLKRSASVVLDLPDAIFVRRATNYGISQIDFEDPDASANYIIPLNAGLAMCDRQEITHWLNHAVRARRLEQLTTESVDYIMDHREFAKTTAHLHYLWPNLIRLINRRAGHDISRYLDRAQHLPRYRKPYLPPALLAKTYAPIIQAADGVLMKGMELPKFDEDYKVVRACVEQWEQKEGDPRFPVVIDV